MGMIKYRIVISTLNRPKREITTIMGQGSLVELFGRCCSYFESNIPGTVFISK